MRGKMINMKTTGPAGRVVYIFMERERQDGGQRTKLKDIKR